MDDTGVEPVTSRMLSARDNQLHQSPGDWWVSENTLLDQFFIWKRKSGNSHRIDGSRFLSKRELLLVCPLNHVL